ncbi:Hypothetical protein CAP_0979 [Chondromyces apiculatus DSM 436]|uniref:Uncharacterized protein n=1 Tax=Chondromyces apiculatus DSM 436 TaxID=1192034 RepID=A0A017STI6_9BACT|nr:Hypothetical protein CAP_0979 [Chondromyces apiculatus DSM 436]
MLRAVQPVQGMKVMGSGVEVKSCRSGGLAQGVNDPLAGSLTRL